MKLTRKEWRQICHGEGVDASTWSWYEGARERVVFSFNHPERGDLTVAGDDGAEHFNGSIDEAQISGGEFPPRQPDATEFTVHEGGTLEMSGVKRPEN